MQRVVFLQGSETDELSFELGFPFAFCCRSISKTPISKAKINANTPQEALHDHGS